MSHLIKISLIIASITASSSSSADTSKNGIDNILSCNAIKSESHFYISDSAASNSEQGLWTTGETSTQFECQRAEKSADPPFPDQNLALWACTEIGNDKDALTIEISYHGFSGWTVGHVFKNRELIDALVCPRL